MDISHFAKSVDKVNSPQPTSNVVVFRGAQVALAREAGLLSPAHLQLSAKPVIPTTKTEPAAAAYKKQPPPVAAVDHRSATLRRPRPHTFSKSGDAAGHRGVSRDGRRGHQQEDRHLNSQYYNVSESARERYLDFK